MAKSDGLGALRLGLIGGVAAVLVALVGMVEVFGKRDIIAGVISMGQTLLVITILLVGYITARRTDSGHRLMGIASGALAGLVTGGLLAVLVVVGKAVNLRPIFINASPALYALLTFGIKDTLTGLLSLLAVGAVIGAVAGLIQWLPARIRSAVIAGLLLVWLIGLLQDLLRVTLTPFPQVTKAVAWMFGSRGEKGLSVPGAIVVFAVVAAANYLWSAQGGNLQRRIRALPPSGQRGVRWGGFLFLLAALLVWPQIAGPYLSDVSNQVGLYVLAGLGLNIVVGFAGLLDLGYVAFFAIGAYVMGVMTTTGGEIATNFQWTFWEALPVAVGVSVLFGVLLGIPVLKMRGDYLAIVTLGFGEIIRILAISDFLKPYEGGSLGIVLVGRPTLGEFVLETPQALYYLILGGCLLAIFVSWRLRDSRIGRTWKAMREDEDVAQAMGIHLVTTKLMAFGAGAAFSGLSGAIFAAKLSTVYPHSFTLLFSINVLSLIIVGGMGSLPGVVVGALALVGLPELLREFSEYRLLMYGALLIVMMLNRPEGFWPEATHRRELHAEEVAAEPAPAATLTPAP